MKTHILLTILAFIISACASKDGRDLASSREEQRTIHERAQHTQMIDGQASRVR